MRYSILILAVSISVCMSESMTQTDWSEGPGEIEPVALWQNAFKACSGIDFQSPGEIALGTGVVTFELNLVSSGFLGTDELSCADLDGDGDMDIILSDEDTWMMYFFENLDGVGGQWEYHDLFDIPWIPTRTILPVDLDEDGDMDILATCGHFFCYWENTDGSGLNWNSYYLEDDFEAFDVLCFDIDQDGDNDVVGSVSFDNRIISWENLDGLGHQWTERTISDTCCYASDLSSCDFDGDGDTDFLCSLEGSNAICLYDNLGGQSWDERVVFATRSKSIPVADFDNDGDNDIALFYGPSYRIMENTDGAGYSWQAHILPSTPNNGIGFGVQAIDVDQDGDIDLFGELGTIIGITGYRGIFIFENVDATCSQWVLHSMIMKPNNIGNTTCCGDIDGDGFPEFPAFHHTDDELVWCDLIGPADTGWFESSILQVSDTDWESIDWIADLPSGSDIYFQLRSSMNWESMGAWSDPIEQPGSIAGILSDGDEYVQYMATIVRNESSQEPTLQEVTLTWLLGIEAAGQTDPLFFIENPVSGSVTARVLLENASAATLQVFNIAGRLVREHSDLSLVNGMNEIHFADLVPGTYFCRLATDDDEMTARFTVVTGQ